MNKTLTGKIPCGTYKNKLWIRRIVTALLAAWLIVGMHVYIPSMGGNGLRLPTNLLAWAVMLLVILTLGLWPHSALSIRNISATSLCFLLGCIILTVPMLYTRSEWVSITIFRLAALFCGLIFYLTIRLIGGGRFRQHIVYIIIASAIVEALIGLAQMVIPGSEGWEGYSPSNDGRPVGSFRQVNILATFLATGLALLMAGWLGGSARRKRKVPSGIGIAFLSCVILLCQSQTGFIAVLLSYFFLVVVYRRRGRVCFHVGICILAGIFAGFLLNAQLSTKLISHDSTTSFRIFIIENVLKIISQKPFIGSGYGGFEFIFHHFTQVDLRLDHPHNEVLLWWIEGGVVGLIGTMILLSGGSLMAFSACKNGIGGRLCGLLPLSLHALTEYPFYLSATAFLVFLLLLALVVPIRSSREGIVRPWTITITVISAPLIVVLITITLLAGIALSKIEASGFSSDYPLPKMRARWLIQERVDYAEKTQNLMVFNQNGDVSLLFDYLIWGEKWLKVHPDKNVYRNMIAAYVFFGNSPEQLRLRQEAELLYPDSGPF